MDELQKYNCRQPREHRESFMDFEARLSKRFLHTEQAAGTSDDPVTYLPCMVPHFPYMVTHLHTEQAAGTSDDPVCLTRKIRA